MRIAVNTRFLLPNRPSGIGTFTQEILRRLTINYPQHEFYFLFDRPFDKQFIYQKNVNPIVVYPPVRHPWFLYWWYQVSLARTLKKLQPDVFLSPDGMFPLNTQVPRVIVMQTVNPHQFIQKVDFISQKYNQYYGTRLVQGADKIVAISEYNRQEVSRQYGVALNKIEVVHQAAGLGFRPLSYERQVAVREKIAAGEAYFLYAGSLESPNNLENLFRAYDAFKSMTGSEVKLVIVGVKKKAARGIRNAYNQMQFKTEVIFTGLRSNEKLVNLYGAAVATVYIPALAGVEMPILEAQQCGCPVITSQTGAIPEVAGSGALVVPLATEEITAALVQVYHQVEVRARLVQAGYLNAQRFSWDASAEKVMRILEATVKSATNAPALL